MMLKRLVCAALLVMAHPAEAAEILKKVPASLAPDKAYLVLELRNHDDGPMPGHVVLARYDPAKGDVRGGARSPETALPKGTAPRIAVARRPLVKTKKSRLYLVEVEPDTWVLEGAGGTAFSLGSTHFSARAGEVVDLGVMTPRTDWRDGEGPEKLTAGKLAGIMLLGAFAKKDDPTPAMIEVRERAVSDLALPPELAAKVVLKAEYARGAKFGNYLGGLVNRIDGRTGRSAGNGAVAVATGSDTSP
jgi:hypothetical protein